MIKNILTVVLGIAGLLFVYVFLLPHLQNPNASMGDDAGVEYGSEQIACTMDAKMCPDGTYVGRSGPKCEFAPCPNYVVTPDTPPQSPGTSAPRPADPVMCTADAKICPDGSGVGRVGPNCEFAACPGE